MKKYFLLLLASVLLTSCASMQDADLSIEEIKYLKQVMSEDLTFTVPADSIETAWSRGFKFLNKYCDTKLQTVSDFHIETYNADKGAWSMQYGYSMTRVKLGNNYEVTVTGHGNNHFTDGWLPENLHIMARFMRTGDLPYPRLIDGRGNNIYVRKLRNQYKSE